MGNFTGFQKSQDYYQHPKLGLIKRIQTEGGPQLIEYKVAVESQQVFEEWKSYLRNFEHSNLSEVLFIPHNYYFQRVGYCGWNGEVFLLYEDFMFSLKDEIQNRYKIRRPYSQSTVIQMLYRLMKAQRDLQKLNFRIGHVNSDSIMVNQDGDWRIISEHSYPHSYFTPIIEQKQAKSFLSPEEYEEQKNIGGLTRSKSLKQMKEINRNQKRMQLNQNVAQTFSIGMLLLEICTLEKSSLIYKNGFNIGLLHDRIKIAQTRYSFAFLNILKGMLELVPNQRIKCEDIVKILEPYEMQILAHKQISLHFDPMAEANKNTKNQVNSSINTKNFYKNPNKWQRLTNFFPFLHQQTKNNQEMKTIHRSNSCFGQRRNVSVA